MISVKLRALGYTYERLDGSVRGEERYIAVDNFNRNDDTFVFLLSTRAGCHCCFDVLNIIFRSCLIRYLFIFLLNIDAHCAAETCLFIYIT
jgi:hypothetical protein